MLTNREALEQKLLEQAQQAIRKLLDDLPESSDITLSDMERATEMMGQAMMHQTMWQRRFRVQLVLPSARMTELCGGSTTVL